MKTEKNQIYGQNRGERDWKYTQEEMKRCHIGESNKNIIKRWQIYIFAKGSNHLRVAKLTRQMLSLLKSNPLELQNTTKNDIENITAWINTQQSWADATRTDYRRLLRQFFNWYQDEDPRLKNGKRDEAEDLYRWIRKNVSGSYKLHQIDYGSILNENDLQILIEKGCRSVRERALISLLHEGGFRSDELLNIRIGDINDSKDDELEIVVDGKTGKRKVPIYLSMGYLLTHLQNHPKKNERSAFIFLSENRKNLNQPLGHAGATKIVRKIFERAELNKKHNLHWFRHSRATLNAQFMMEVVLCKFMGWVPGSRIVRTYYHGNVEQIKQALLAHHGLTKEKEKINIIRCSRCDLPNKPEQRYCSRCGRPLSVTIALEGEQQKGQAINEAFELLTKIMQDPDLLKKFEEYKTRIPENKA